MIGLHRVAHRGSGRHPHRHDSEDRGEDADRAQDQREDDQLHRKRARAGRRISGDEIRLVDGIGGQDDRGDQRDFVGLENVGRHSGAVADVVADVVGDGRGVARIVFGDPGFDFADQVAADIGRLGDRFRRRRA